MTILRIDNSNPLGTNLDGIYAVNGAPLSGLRNKIINGKMEISQRGTSFAAASNGQYTLDRFACNLFGSGVVTISQQADAPISNEFQNSLRVAVTTADTSIAATDLYAIYQSVEGFNSRDLIGRTFALSFWVRSSKTGIHCINVGNNNDRSYVAEYTVNAANTWEYKTINVSGGLITSGTWNWTNGGGVLVRWALASGTNSQTTAGAWQTGNFLATANQVNCLDTVGNIFAITGVQLEVGSVASAFEHRHRSFEVALCKWYTRIIRVGMVTSGYVQDYPFEEMRGIPLATFLPGITFTGGTFAATTAFSGRQSAYSSVAGDGLCLLSAEL